MKLERGFFVCLWTHAFDSTEEFLTHLQGWGRCWFSVWNRNAKIYLQYFCLYQHRISRAGAIWRQIEYRDHVHAGVSLWGEALPRIVPLCVCVSGHQVFGCMKGVCSLVSSTPFSLVPKLCGMPPYPPVVRSDVSAWPVKWKWLKCVLLDLKNGIKVKSMLLRGTKINQGCLCLQTRLALALKVLGNQKSPSLSCLCICAVQYGSGCLLGYKAC